jgi:hypothetical protein
MAAKGVQVMATDPTPEEMQEIANALLLDVRGWFFTLAAKHPDVDPVTLGKLAAVALSSFLGRLALDVGMSEEAFVNVSRATYREATQTSQKWGQ